jgi:hypothetical protein
MPAVGKIGNTNLLFYRLPVFVKRKLCARGGGAAAGGKALPGAVFT